MQTRWPPSASYSLWSLFAPPVGKEGWHCDMKRGFSKARNKELEVKALLKQDNTYQRIGILAQKGVYEFHQDAQLFNRADGVELVAKILRLNQELDEVQNKVISILKNYYEKPLLIGKNIIKLNRGDEKPIEISIQHSSYLFNLYVVFDCIFAELDGILHILDFKTGKSEFDQRQAYVYLLAARYLYPQKTTVASFYNLEFAKASESIAAIPEELIFVQIELAEIARKHEIEKERYEQNPSQFAQIFPPNPGTVCQACSFNSICNFLDF